MNYFTKNKIFFWCVIVLIIMNTAVLTSLWFKQKEAPEDKKQEQGRIANGNSIMEERLNLSESQAKEFEKIRQEHFERTDPLLRDIQRLRIHILDETFRPQTDEAEINRLLALLEEKQSEFDRNLFNHFLELKNACEPEQVGKLREMLTRLVDSNSSTLPRPPHKQRPQDGNGLAPERRMPPPR